MFLWPAATSAPGGGNCGWGQAWCKVIQRGCDSEVRGGAHAGGIRWSAQVERSTLNLWGLRADFPEASDDGARVVAQDADEAAEVGGL